MSTLVYVRIYVCLRIFKEKNTIYISYIYIYENTYIYFCLKGNIKQTPNLEAMGPRGRRRELREYGDSDSEEDEDDEQNVYPWDLVVSDAMHQISTYHADDFEANDFRFKWIGVSHTLQSINKVYQG